MKKTKIGWYVAAMALVGIGAAMAVTNPDQERYNQYAAQRLSQHLQEEECVKLDDAVRELCKLLEREQGQALLTRLIADNTERQDFLLWSTYTTNLSTQNLLPSFLSNLLSVPTLSYRAETVGLFGQFQTYRIERE
ncbi:MAG: DUF4359 domain-containing protein [Leptolyngbya sp. IPPAS B-1204]|nr:DUF4359 domain-containing protein [Elainella sp. C42_A2020_010]RNJ70883.1 MAG: DUF4359 domain-containing protein [Leptolyngbya sp. IPPAS B-1204]